MRKITAKMLCEAYGHAYTEVITPTLRANFPPQSWEQTNAIKKRAYQIMADILNKQLQDTTQPVLLSDEETS